MDRHYVEQVAYQMIKQFEKNSEWSHREWGLMGLNTLEHFSNLKISVLILKFKASNFRVQRLLEALAVWEQNWTFFQTWNFQLGKSKDKMLLLKESLMYLKPFGNKATLEFSIREIKFQALNLIRLIQWNDLAGFRKWTESEPSF